MWQALQQQGVFEATTVTTGLANRDTWQSYGPASSSIKFLSHYVWDGPATTNKVNNWLVAKMKRARPAARTSSRRTASTRR